MLKNLISPLLIFICILFIEVFFVSLFTLSMPNQFTFTALDNFSLYMNLLNVNPKISIELALIQNPVFIVQRLDAIQATQVWGVYFMPINIITLFLLSTFISIIKKKQVSLSQWLWIFFASSILMFSMLYLRIQTCCTSSPTWLLDIWLFSLASGSFADASVWQNIYIRLGDYLKLIQFLIAFIGIVILFVLYNAASTKNKTLN